MPIRTRWMLLLTLAALAVGARPATAQSALEWVEGRWRWEHNETGCDSAYVITVPDGDKYVISSWVYQGRRDTSEYRVLAHAPGEIRAQIEGEERKDAAGNAVIWDFVRLSEDAFCWHRADWGDDDCTRPLVRCTVSVPRHDARAGAVDDPPWNRRRPAGR